MTAQISVRAARSLPPPATAIERPPHTPAPPPSPIEIYKATEGLNGTLEFPAALSHLCGLFPVMVRQGRSSGTCFPLTRMHILTRRGLIASTERIELTDLRRHG